MDKLLVNPGTRRAMAVSATLLTAGFALAAAGTTGADAAADSTHQRSYVALGDSYASAPLIPTQIDARCLRSNQNYPSLAAEATGAALTDVSCAGATTAHMRTAQGSAPAQLDALSRSTDAVTVTIGGNDIGFSDVLRTCASVSASDPDGAPCRAHFTGTGTDAITRSVRQTAPKVAQVLRDIHRRSPHARVVVVGYPDLFPDDGVGCTSSAVPLAAGDFSYLRDKEKELNTMLARQARRHGASYVDTYRPTVGHDLCRPTDTRWIETFAPERPAAPVHPNALGEKAMARAVGRALFSSSWPR
ncbi:SGNH/GDSL hydrolase family protein [Streptomyces sp. BBFR25]|uniref:SGNH/GDSL hydrolase family protein n=1 Tax=Streptomyces sp. BBFR25 TaxID=3372855 RepID=UPI0037DC7F68